MNINHHADDATLLLHAAGALPAGMSLVIASHAEFCPKCAARLAEAEKIGGQMLQDIDSLPLADNALANVMAMLDGVEREADKPRPARSDLPRALQELLPGGLKDIKWRRIAPGVRQFVFDQIDSARGTVRLLGIAPGTTVPRHSHGGNELTLVLSGAYSDEVGCFGPGDLADLDDGVEHQPVTDGSEECICLVATDERLKFSGLFGPLMNPLTGM